MEKDYVLMNKDLPLTSFHLKDIGLELFSVGDVAPINASPYNSERVERLEDFLQKRVQYILAR